MTNVAFIGIGAMGEPMATNLLKKGFSLTAMRHRRAEAAARLQALGAKIAATPAEAVDGCELVVLCLPTSREDRTGRCRDDARRAGRQGGEARVLHRRRALARLEPTEGLETKPRNRR